MHEQTPQPRGVQRLEVDKVANISPRILGHCGLNLDSIKLIDLKTKVLEDFTITLFETGT